MERNLPPYSIIDELPEPDAMEPSAPSISIVLPGPVNMLNKFPKKPEFPAWPASDDNTVAAPPVTPYCTADSDSPKRDARLPINCGVTKLVNESISDGIAFSLTVSFLRMCRKVARAVCQIEWSVTIHQNALPQKRRPRTLFRG
jgi:hypothetical protein